MPGEKFAGEVSGKILGKLNTVKNYLSGARSCALHGGGQKVPGENPAEGVLAVGVQIR